MRLPPLLILLALGALACGAPFTEPEHSGAPAIGAIAVTIDARYNVGDAPDPDGYLITGPGFDTLVSSYGETIVTPGFPDGFVAQIKIERVAEWCHAAPPSHTATIRGEDTIPMLFVLTCSPLSRPVRFMLRSKGVRTDTSAVTIQMQNVGPSVVVHSGDTVRMMIPVTGHAVTLSMPGSCRRLPTDVGVLDVPYYPSDTINYVINRNCGVVRVLATIPNGNTPQMLVEAAVDSAYWSAVANLLPDAWGTRVSYNNATIARARRRVNGGVTEWAITRTGATTENEGLLRPWNSTLTGYPAWRRDNSRVDFLVQDTTGVTLWSNANGGGDLQQLTVPGTLALGSPDWSPDGTRLAYVTDSGIAIAQLNAGAAEHLYTPSVSLTLTDPRWLPSGDTLIVAGAIDTVGGTRNALWRLEVATGTMVQLTTPPLGKTDGHADVSSDGKYLAFFRSNIVPPGADGAPRLMTLSLQTGLLRQLDLPGPMMGDPMWAR